MSRGGKSGICRLESPPAACPPFQRAPAAALQAPRVDAAPSTPPLQPASLAAARRLGRSVPCCRPSCWCLSRLQLAAPAARGILACRLGRRLHAVRPAAWPPASPQCTRQAGWSPLIAPRLSFNNLGGTAASVLLCHPAESMMLLALTCKRRRPQAAGLVIACSVTGKNKEICEGASCA
jgi:hypothetical protein